MVDKSKALSAIANLPIFSQALTYLGSDAKAPGVSKPELRAFCDSVLDIVHMNNLDCHISLNTEANEMGGVLGAS